jgi:hypothetical protein
MTLPGLAQGKIFVDFSERREGRSSAISATMLTCKLPRYAVCGDEANTMAFENLSAMDAPENMSPLHRLGIVAGQRNCHGEHFPAVFDLT